MTKKSCPLGEDCDLTKARIAALAGEVEVEIDGVRHVCRLTLGAIAEMEAATGESVIKMVERFETGRWRAGDVLAVLVAGLRGGGWRVEAAALRAARIAGGPGGGGTGGGGAARGGLRGAGRWRWLWHGAEAKLAKAVKALERIYFDSAGDEAIYIARAALAELKGDKP